MQQFRKVRQWAKPENCCSVPEDVAETPWMGIARARRFSGLAGEVKLAFTPAHASRYAGGHHRDA